VTAPGVARVLVAEDEWIVAYLLREVLEQAGLEVVGLAESEAEALRLGERTAPTHAVLDVHLAGGSDGLVVARELRARFRTAVVYATGNGPTVRADLGAPCGVLLDKPYLPEHVILALHVARKLLDGEPVPALPHGLCLVNAPPAA
jgi:CheY-like chemotaxis protein